jgi:hypothetical protein
MTIIRKYGLDEGRMEAFIRATVDAGGQVAPLTLCTAQWIKTFQEDHDHRFLIEGVAYGFDWPAEDPEEFYEIPNYVKPEHEDKVSSRIAEELRLGQIACTTRENVCGLAAIGVVDKQQSGFSKYRVVHDLSRPYGMSVNDHMDVEKRSFASFSTACDYMSPRAYMCKVDLANAYRSVPMAQCWWPRHAFQWKGTVYQDLRMPFGNSGAPAAFDRITQAIVRLQKAKGQNAFVGYLDDFWMLTRQ